ncbi:hypothetical protein INT47_007568 [Mucor saturninus]|uniref:Uncharacterized protein n=1 Tax=Mucor saturninus TaxID=64648 RepID=A0A8H7V619_9FUNG|nr:hypothetical protein INT47_007568 [Mucor saturninus]
MQWGSLIMLACGLVVVYLAILSQDVPYPHPKTIYTSNGPLFRNPDQVILTTVGPWIYLTSMQFQQPTHEPFIGIHNLKLGVIKQYKKPISNLQSERELLESDGWEPCFEHTLRGQISKVSERKNSTTWHFGVLYHHVENDHSFHFVRVYYTVDHVFEYKDIKLPGTIWVDSISLEYDSIIFSRDPDLVEFHIMTLPSTLIEPPHSDNAQDITLDTVQHGRAIQEWSQPASTEEYATLFSRLYSHVNDTYRVFTLSVHRTTSTFYVNITIADNVTMTTSENQRATTWIEREKAESKYPVINTEEMIDYGGFADISNYKNIELRTFMPQLHATVSSDLKTIVFPFLKNKFITLDYTENMDMLKRIPSESERLYSNDNKQTVLAEYYYWQPYKSVDADIMGVQLNEDGSILALWTEFNHVYIYKRGTDKVERSLLGKIDRWLDHVLSDMSDEEKEIRRLHFPPFWELEMAIAPIRNEYGDSRVVGTVHFWDKNYIFVGYKNGFVNSYRIDSQEPEKSINFWTFAIERWDMLFAMCAVITIFVYNEYQRPL